MFCRQPVWMRPLLLSLFLMAAGQVAMASTYYVSTGGLDTNPGTQTRPFRTINHAVTLLASGDTLLVNSGTYNENVSLAPLQYCPNVKIQAVATRKAVIDGGNRDGTALGSTLLVEGLKLVGLRIVRGGDYGLRLADASNLSILDCEVSNSFRSILIENGSNVVVRRTYVHDNLKGFIFGFGGQSINGLTIDDCIAANNCWGELEGDADGFLVENVCSEVTISRCTAYGHGDSGFDIKPINVRMDRCAAYNNWQAGFKLWRDGVFLTNSRSTDNEGFGIVAAGNRLRFWNLTVANNNCYSLQLESTNPASVEIRNTIFAHSPIWVKRPTMFRDATNAYWISGTQFMIYLGYDLEWRMNQLVSGVYPLGPRTMACNPRFVSVTNGNYRLATSSPCRAKGSWASFLQYDLDGLRRVSPPDVGCYRYVPPPTSPAP